jgi:hypothetical protein
VLAAIGALVCFAGVAAFAGPVAAQESASAGPDSSAASQPGSPGSETDEQSSETDEQSSETDEQSSETDEQSGEADPTAVEEGADETDQAAEEAEEADGGAEEAEADEAPSITFHGTLEGAYAYNFNDPSNGTNAWRWYDTRHDLVNLQGALLGAEWEAGPVSGRIQLQFGVLTELFWSGTRSVELDLLWRLIQEATTEWHTPYEPLSIEVGLFNVPFGPEYNNAYLNWNWSTSNLFALMPYQIAGARVNYDLGMGLRARVGVYNGWDQIVTDNNEDKSLIFSLEWDDPDDEGNYVYANYMVGVERDTGDARGANPRHTFDAYGQWHAAEPLFLRAHVFAGYEPGTPGDDGWFGAAIFARVEAHSTFSIAARGDFVYTFAGAENLFHSDTLELVGEDLATSTLVGSGTLTLDYHPVSFVSLRVEVRHDRASFPLFFAGEVPRGPVGMPSDEGEDRPTAYDQTTLTVGLTTWF